MILEIESRAFALSCTPSTGDDDDEFLKIFETVLFSFQGRNQSCDPPATASQSAGDTHATKIFLSETATLFTNFVLLLSFCVSFFYCV